MTLHKSVPPIATHYHIAGPELRAQAIERTECEVDQPFAVWCDGKHSEEVLRHCQASEWWISYTAEARLARMLGLNAE